MVSHSPGPWGLSEDGNWIQLKGGSAPFYGDNYLSICVSATSMADKALISAAPELLEASLRAEAMIELIQSTAYQVGLEGTKDWDEVVGGSDILGTFDVLRAAIAKAEGGSDVQPKP